MPSKEQVQTMNNEQNSQHNTHSQGQEHTNSKPNTQNSSQNEVFKEQEKQHYSNFEKRQFFEEALSDYDELLKNNKDFNALHLARSEDERLDKEIFTNDKAIIEKEQEIKQSKKSLTNLKGKRTNKPNLTPMIEMKTTH